MPWQREWSASEREAIWKAFDALTRSCRAEWFGKWSELVEAERVVKLIREVK